MAQAAPATGLVVATHGRHCVVESPDGARRICHPRGKKSQAVVGDRVRWQAAPAGQGDEGTVEAVLPRRNLFYRQDELRTKSFAANLDQVLVLVAAEPEFSGHQLARALVAAEAAHIPALVGLNKRDLAQPFARAWERLAPYRRMGTTVLPLALANPAGDDRATLLAHLRGKATLVLGPSGAGKSTLVNLLVPGAAAQTGEISQALNSGRHTTTSTRWYWVPEAGGAGGVEDAGGVHNGDVNNGDGNGNGGTSSSQTAIETIAAGPGVAPAAGGFDDAFPTAGRTALIDSPGFQEFGLHHLQPAQLAACMPDLARHADACRFYNCTHLHEPGCAVRAAVAEGDAPGAIDPHRMRIYADLYAELAAPPRY